MPYDGGSLWGVGGSGADALLSFLQHPFGQGVGVPDNPLRPFGGDFSGPENETLKPVPMPGFTPRPPLYAPPSWRESLGPGYQNPNREYLPFFDSAPNQGMQLLSNGFRNLRPRAPQNLPYNPPPIQAPTYGPADVNMPDGLDHSSREAFIASVLPYAVAAEARTGIPADLASLMIAININEQGHARQAPGNNLFGIKGKHPVTGRSFMTPTWEVYNGVRHDIQDEFRAYDSPADSYEDFWRFLTANSRYQPALAVLQHTKDPEQFIRAVHAAGYATDPNWSNQVISIMKQVQAIRAAQGRSPW